jgi:hypothetical protein
LLILTNALFCSPLNSSLSGETRSPELIAEWEKASRLNASMS